MFSGQLRTLNIAAWALSVFVVVLGIVMFVVTDRRIFLLFPVLGVLGMVNVLMYDRLVLKPRIAAQQAKAAQDTAPATPEPPQPKESAE